MTLKNRFEIRMGDDMVEAIENLTDDLGTNNADVIRRAVSLYARVKRDKNDHVILEKRENNNIIRRIELEIQIEEEKEKTSS